MPLQDYQKKMIDLFTRQEYLLSEIYGSFAGRFEEHAEFWRIISGEELEHAGWLKELKKLIDNKKAHFKDDKTRTYTLNTLIEYQRKTLQDAVDGRFTLKEAFAKTTDLEYSLIERRVFEHFEPDSTDVILTLNRLAEATRDHLLRVRSYIKDNKL